ncbi:type II secretion system protein [Glaciecola sp. 1036]|uniref:type II secretion system protein n=1 Tax=Alteromonadaceae TaxID=72275 RepID=UPI003CFCD228
MKRSSAKHNQTGFTLVELILVIVLLGIIGAGSAHFIRSASDVYVDVTEREALLRNASFAVERFTRELASAVPNSVRVSGNTSVHCLEFVPIKWNAYYLSLPSVSGSSAQVDIVQMADIDGNPYVPSGSDMAIVYPLQASHVYNASENRRQAITACTDDGQGDCSLADDPDHVVQLTVSDGFPLSSPTRRLYIADSSISYCLRGQQLYRHTSSINSTQTLYTSGGQLMAQGLQNVLSSNPQATPGALDPFRVVDATLTRNGFTRANFLFARSDEQISIVKEVHIPNVP